jgi:protein-disulfide isomerase
MRKQVYGLATMLTLMSSGAMATDIMAMSPQEREMFGAEVRSYLMENPHVLDEVNQALEARRAEAQAERDAQMVVDNSETLYGDPLSPMIGSEDATFTVVKFNDYNCGHCRETAPDLIRFLEEHPDSRLIIKEYPVLGPESVIAASFAVTIWDLAGQEGYELVKERLFERAQGPRDAEFFRTLSAEAGVDPDLMTERMGSEEVRAHLQRNLNLANEMEIRGTPGLVFEDIIVRGRVPLEVMMQIRQHIETR